MTSIVWASSSMRDGDVAGDEVRLVLRFEGEVVREVARSTQFGDHLGEPLGEGGELLLLALDDDESSTFANLEEEESIADLPAHADHDLVGIGEDVVHEGARSFSESVLLTLNTTGVRVREADRTDRTGGDHRSLEEVERHALGVGDGGLDRIGVTHDDDGAVAVLARRSARASSTFAVASR